VIFLYQVRRLQVGHRFPGVIAFRVALPLDQVLQLFLPSMTSVAPDGLDLVLFLAFYQVRGWPRVVLAVFFCLDIWGKDRGVEYRVNGPLWGKGQLIRHWRDHLSDLEWPMTSRGQFYRAIREHQVLRIKPYPLP
jgi:hypothetical protein